MLALAVLGAVVLAGCGDAGTTGSPSPDDAASGTPTADGGSTEDTPSSVPSPDDTGASEASGSAMPADAGGCDPEPSAPEPEVPNGAERVREAIGDLDGDDVPDRLVTWAVTLGDDETVFSLRVVTGSGHVAERELTRAGATADVRPLGTVPIGDGHQAALVVEDVGASVELVSLWGLHDWDDEPCSLGRLTVADDAAPVVFPVGATVGVTNGLACTEVEGVSTLAMREATASEDGASYAWQETHLFWEGAGALRAVSRDEGTFPADDARRDRFASLDCPGVEL